MATESLCKEKGLPLPKPKNSEADKTKESSQSSSGSKEDRPAVIPGGDIKQPSFDEDKPSDSGEDSDSGESSMMFGLTKEEMDELNRVVDEEIEREKKEADSSAKPEGAPSPDYAGDGEGTEPAGSGEDAPASPDDDFMDILRKRSQGKNDEVE